MRLPADPGATATARESRAARLTSARALRAICAEAPAAGSKCAARHAVRIRIRDMSRLRVVRPAAPPAGRVCARAGLNRADGIKPASSPDRLGGADAPDHLARDV